MPAEFHDFRHLRDEKPVPVKRSAIDRGDLVDTGARFGDTSIQAITSDPEKTSIYASVDAAEPGRTVLVAINKTGGPLSAAVTLAANADYQSVDVWQLTGAAPTLVSVPGPALVDTNAFQLPLPAYSVSVVVPRP